MKALIIIVLLASCIVMPHVDPQPRYGTDRALTVAYVESECAIDYHYMGRTSTATGVVISERHVLTAAHTVACADIPYVHVTVNGRRLRAVVTREDANDDIARLELASADSFHINVPPPVLGRAERGEAVCVNRIWLNTPTSCGWADWAGTIVRGLRTRSGDSGAPVYNYYGTLVGLVVGGNGTDTRVTVLDASWLEGT